MSSFQKVRRLLTPVGVLRDAVAFGPEDRVRKELPWTVSWVRTASEFREALQLRTDAYGRHFSSTELALDEHDLAENAFILTAREKRTGVLLGSMRVAFGLGRDIEMLSFHPKPEVLDGVRLGEARRLSLKASRSATLVKLSLWKSFWLACVTHDVESLLIAARPPMNDDYRLLLFQEAMQGGVWFEPDSVPNPHELLILPVLNLEARYRAHSAELHRFMCLLNHPDIAVIQADATNPMHGADLKRVLDERNVVPIADVGLSV
jgi:hypothetical protein